MTNCIKYKGGYKYQTQESYTIYVGDYVKPFMHIDNQFIALNKEGLLFIREGYAWDGPSGPAIDTKNFMRGSLVHDALYQLMRKNLLSRKYRKATDKLLRTHCREDGMSAIRAWWVYHGVRIGSKQSSINDKRRPVTSAPKGCQKAPTA